MQREAEYEQEIEAKSRSPSARRLRPEALNRLCYGHRQKEVEMEALRDYLASHEDPQTGRPLFQPHITRGPRPTSSTSGSVAGTSAADEWEKASQASSMPGSAQQGADGSQQGGGGGGDGGGGALGRIGECGGVVGLRAHQRGDSRLITGECLHTARVKQRRSREALQSEKERQENLQANMPTQGAFTRGLTTELVQTMREGR